VRYPDNDFIQTGDFHIDLLKPGSMNMHEKGFFYRAQMFIEFPASPKDDINLPQGEWWSIGGGLGDEDVGSMSGLILVDKLSGQIAYYNHVEIVLFPMLKRIYDFFVKPKKRNLAEHEFFIISKDIQDFVNAINRHKAKIS
jgi:hypothetical protein